MKSDTGSAPAVERPTPLTKNRDFTDFIADALTSYIAGEDELSDFIVRQGDNEIVYVDVENGELPGRMSSGLFLITVAAAEVRVG